MVYAVLAIIVIVWWIAWWGSGTLEVRGVARRIERAIGRRFRATNDDGFAMVLVRGTGAGLVTMLATWGGFISPCVLLTLVAWLFG